MQRFVILSARRSGSNLLCTLLGSHPEILCHHEIFNPRGIFFARELRDGALDLGTIEARDRDPLAFLERVWAARGDESCVGFKWTQGQDEVILRHVLEDPGCKKIVLHRQNRIKRYVSERIAEATDVWELYEGERRAAAPPRIEARLEDVRAHAAAAERLYAALDAVLGGADPGVAIRADYERLFDANERKRLLVSLGVRAPDHPLVATSVKQNATDLRDSIANYDEFAAEVRGTDLEPELLDEGELTVDEPCYVEHTNMSVSDLDASIAFFRTAFPHFRVRGRGKITDCEWGGEWLHLGTDSVYVALQTARPGATGRGTPYDDPGYNHVAFVVDDLDAVRRRLLDAGYREGLLVPPHPHRKRMYWHDPDGHEIEFIEYLSDDPAERNEYSDVD